MQRKYTFFLIRLCSRWSLIFEHLVLSIELQAEGCTLMMKCYWSGQYSRPVSVSVAAALGVTA